MFPHHFSHNILSGVAVLAMGFFLVACDGSRAANDDPIADALASPARPSDDRDLDVRRKPAEVLRFIDIQPGDIVFEVEAGRGYYTDLFSSLTGTQGQVIMQNPPSFDSFLGDAVAARLANNQFGNVIISKSSFNILEADDQSVDIVTWLLGPHELFFTPSDGADLGNPEESFAEMHRILKEDGTLIILDHGAAAGAPPETGGTLHRIDPALVKAWAQAAGFTLVAESDALANPDDDYEMSVFDPKVRRTTDRFLMKFSKLE